MEPTVCKVANVRRSFPIRSELSEIWSRSLSNVTLVRLSCQEVKHSRNIFVKDVSIGGKAGII